MWSDDQRVGREGELRIGLTVFPLLSTRSVGLYSESQSHWREDLAGGSSSMERNRSMGFRYLGWVSGLCAPIQDLGIRQSNQAAVVRVFLARGVAGSSRRYRLLNTGIKSDDKWHLSSRFVSIVASSQELSGLFWDGKFPMLQQTGVAAVSVSQKARLQVVGPKLQVVKLLVRPSLNRRSGSPIAPSHQSGPRTLPLSMHGPGDANRQGTPG